MYQLSITKNMETKIHTFDTLQELQQAYRDAIADRFVTLYEVL